MTESVFTFEWPSGPKSVSIVGQFNSWGEPIALQLKSNERDVEEFQLELPVSIENGSDKLHFKFIVDDNWVVSDEYKKDTDANGNENNYIEKSDLNVKQPKSRRVKIKKKLRRNKKTGEVFLVSEEFIPLDDEGNELEPTKITVYEAKATPEKPEITPESESNGEENVQENTFESGEVPVGEPVGEPVEHPVEEQIEVPVKENSSNPVAEHTESSISNSGDSSSNSEALESSSIDDSDENDENLEVTLPKEINQEMAAVVNTTKAQEIPKTVKKLSKKKTVVKPKPLAKKTDNETKTKKTVMGKLKKFLSK
ncbi:hypothetical protein TPHA_0O01560 [Tetrapisispora phaffii CBS 4417]|uniref:AMP-activated protein kinase glycogen-binding domain-containing protein n=1 Tax=Tetrapisispora phaffii (strain ATCC 24235 / CBS 4417 / NBRC 1672 / NRRL Y-8282 / UCD 70-5) TaxID=1071381 RepID=G8C1U5_TETPH|nr:hypothetical protein TPHA_0O01560 [Tetrapisispora phaffii CBS 4417]CCE66123.1 hypothetical protein TPHA_0O01560 [Tetrapisispora phaffii CBS 4417]